jgi:hypothetical protein
MIFDESNYLLSLHCGKAKKKIVNGFASLKIINEILDRHPCARKNRRPAHNLTIAMKDLA